MNNNDVEKILESLVANYYELYPDMSKIAVKILISDCLSKTYMELRPDLEELPMKDGIYPIDNYNGLMLVPNKIGDTSNIILNKRNITISTKDKSLTWVGTLAHELTHAIDFYQMAALEQLDSYDSLLKTDDYLMFQLWSEYHARKIGYSFLRKQLGADTDSRTEMDRIQYIMNTEWPTHFNQYIADYHATSDGNQQMNDTMQLLGRYSVWCELFPHYFNHTSLQITFKHTPWMSVLFDFLTAYNSLHEAYPHFEDMKGIVRTNWSCL